MILQIAVPQEIMENIDHNDTMIPTTVIKDKNETDHDLLVAFRDPSHEAQIYSEIVHSIDLAANTH